MRHTKKLPPTQNILFLDIDGVLNSEQYYDWRHENHPEYYKQNETKLDRDKWEFDPRTIELLNDLVSECNFKVVLSSSWRVNNPDSDNFDYMNDLFKAVGATFEIYDFTPHLFFNPRCNYKNSVPRGVEIDAWISENIEGRNYREYIILDDDGDMMWWQRENFFLVDRYCGLTKNITYRIKRKFGK